MANNPTLKRQIALEVGVDEELLDKIIARLEEIKAKHGLGLLHAVAAVDERLNGWASTSATGVGIGVLIIAAVEHFK